MANPSTIQPVSFNHFFQPVISTAAFAAFNCCFQLLLSTATFNRCIQLLHTTAAFNRCFQLLLSTLRGSATARRVEETT